MNRAELTKARRLITATAGLRVTGTRIYGRGSYSIDVVDTITGVPFVLHTLEDVEGQASQPQDRRICG